MNKDEISINIIVNYGEKNAEVVKTTISEIQARLEKLGNVRVKFIPEKPEDVVIDSLFDKIKEKTNIGLQNLINSIGDRDTWTRAFDKLSEYIGGLKVNPAQYLYKQSEEFKNLYYSSLEDFRNIVSAMTKKTEAELSNTARMFKALKKDIKEATIDPEIEKKLSESLVNFSEKAVKMTFALQERIRQIYTAFLRESASELSNINIDLTTSAKEIVENYPDIFNNIVNTILKQMAVGGKNLSEVFQGLFSGDYADVNILDFYDRLSDALKNVSELQKRFGGDLVKAYEQWQQSTEYAKGYRSELLQMGIQMWFMSIAIRQLMNSIQLIIEGDNILTAQMELLSNTLANMTYGWFAWSRMIEMTWKSMVNFNALTESMQKSLSRHIGITSNWIALVISLLISLIPYITQYQNKIREGFQKTAKDIASFEDTLKQLLNPKNLETYLSNLEEVFKKYYKTFKKAGLSREEIFEGLKTEANFEIILKPILNDKLIKDFLKTPEGKTYIQKAQDELLKGPFVIATEPIEFLVGAQININEQIMEKAKQLFKEDIRKNIFTEEDFKKEIELQRERWRYVEDYFKSTIVPTLTFKEQLATMDEKEIEILKTKAEIEQDYHTQHLIYMEERKRKLRELGYDESLVTKALELEEQKYQKEIENTNNKLKERIYEIQGKKYEAFVLELENEINAYKKQGADKILIEQYVTERTKQFWQELAEQRNSFYRDLAKLRGNDREALRLELEKQKNDYRKLGIAEVEIKEWETLKWKEFENEKKEKIQNFYLELYKLRKQDEEVFKIEIERQKKEYEKLGIDNVKIKEWETLKWKQFEEEKTAKMKEEAEKRASAERSFWINFNKLLGKDRLADELALEEEKERLKKQGYINDELINLYIEEEKKQKILNIQKELLNEIKKIILSETEYKVYEFNETYKKYKDYEEARSQLAMLTSLKIKEIYKEETNAIVNEISDRIAIYQKEKEEAISNIEKQGESRKKYLNELYSLDKNLTEIDKKLIELAQERQNIIEETGDENLADIIIQTKISQLIEEQTDKVKDALEDVYQANEEVQNEILKLQGNTLQIEFRNLLEKINKYAEIGADIVKLEELYNLEVLNIKRRAVNDWIAEEKRKFLSARDLEESIRKFQEESLGKQPTKVESAIQQKVDESINLINKVFDKVSSGELTLEEAFNTIQQDILPYVDVGNIIGKYSPLLQKANLEAKQKVVEYANKLYGIYTSQLDYQIPDFESLKLKKPKELPEIITPEIIREKWDKIVNSLEDININVKKWIEEKTKEINQKFMDSIYNDEQIKKAIDKLLHLPYEILTQIDWNALGINVGNDIAEGLITGAVNTLKEKFPGINWDDLIGKIKEGGKQEGIGTRGSKAELPEDKEKPKEIKDAGEIRGGTTDREILKKIYDQMHQLVDNVKNIYNNLDKLPKQFEIVELLEKNNNNQYLLIDYLKGRPQNTVTQTLFSGDVSYEKAGYKDLLEKYWANQNIFASRSWDMYLLEQLYTSQQQMPQKEEIKYKEIGTKFVVPDIDTGKNYIQPPPININVYIDGKKIDGVTTEIVEENLSGKII